MLSHDSHSFISGVGGGGGVRITLCVRQIYTFFAFVIFFAVNDENIVGNLEMHMNTHIHTYAGSGDEYSVEGSRLWVTTDHYTHEQ